MTLIILIYVIIIAIVILGVFFYYASTIFSLLLTKVPPVSSSKTIRKQVIELLNLKPGQTFFDLGSAYGKILIEANKKYPQAKVVGFEISPFFYLITKIKLLIVRSTAKIYLKNFYKTNFSKSDVFYAYLWPSVMYKLQDKFFKETKSGAVLYIHAFKLPKVKPDNTFEFKNGNKIIKIYQYIKK